jgi:hypothetical protein
MEPMGIHTEEERVNYTTSKSVDQDILSEEFETVIGAPMKPDQEQEDQ